MNYRLTPSRVVNTADYYYQGSFRLLDDINLPFGDKRKVATAKKTAQSAVSLKNIFFI